jgi:chorismate mutase
MVSLGIARDAIDVLDDQIIVAVKTRRELAQAIIAQRVQEGRQRVDPERVAQISARYAAGLASMPDSGRRARNFADAVLSVCS